MLCQGLCIILIAVSGGSYGATIWLNNDIYRQETPIGVGIVLLQQSNFLDKMSYQKL
jgi:hypothetical protein